MDTEPSGDLLTQYKNDFLAWGARLADKVHPETASNDRELELQYIESMSKWK